MSTSKLFAVLFISCEYASFFAFVFLEIAISIFLKSNAEARRLLVQNSISINKNKVDQNYIISDKDIVNDCILIQKGKKNYFLLKVI